MHEFMNRDHQDGEYNKTKKGMVKYVFYMKVSGYVYSHSQGNTGEYNADRPEEDHQPAFSSDIIKDKTYKVAIRYCLQLSEP